MITKTEFEKIFSTAIQKNKLKEIMNDITLTYKCIEQMPTSVENKMEIYEKIREDLMLKYFDGLEERIYDGLCQETIDESDRDEIRVALEKAQKCWIDEEGKAHIHYDNIVDNIIISEVKRKEARKIMDTIK